MSENTQYGHPFGLRPDSDSDIRNGLARTYERTYGRRNNYRRQSRHLGRRVREIPGDSKLVVSETDCPTRPQRKAQRQDGSQPRTFCCPGTKGGGWR